MNGEERSFAELLRSYRRAAGLTQEELAERADISVRAVSDLERGLKTRPYRHTVDQLARALGLSTEESVAVRDSIRRVREQSLGSAAAPDGVPQGGFLGAHPTGALIARERETTRILALADRAAGGQGQTVLVGGEPGMGKTRLAQEIMLALGVRDFLVATGRGFEQEQETPFASISEALCFAYDAAPDEIRQNALARWPYLAYVLPQAHLGAQTDDGQDQVRLFWAVHSFLAALAAIRPVALLIDDLHWADKASLDLLLFLARHGMGSRLLLLGTYRDLAVYRRPALETLIRELVRDHMAEIVTLDGLDDIATSALAADALGRRELDPELLALVQRQTGGNPFFVQQTLQILRERGDLREAYGLEERRSLSLVLPVSVRAAIEERLSRLSSATRDLLEMAAVLGQQFAFRELHAMAGRSEGEVEDALLEAEAAGLVRVRDDERFLFTHALIQQAIAMGLSPRRSKRLHRAAGEALEVLQERERAAEITQHLLEGGERARALPWILAAGDRATDVFAHGEALRRYQTALGLAREHGDRDREAAALERLGGTLYHLARPQEAIEQLEQAAALYRDAGDAEGEARAVARVGWAHNEQQTRTEGIARIHEVLADWDEEFSSPTLFALYEALATLLWNSGKYQEALDAAEWAVELAAGADDGLVARAQGRLGLALSSLGRNDEALQALEIAVGRAEAARDLDTLFLALNNLASLRLDLGDVIGAKACRERMCEVAHHMGDPAQVAWATAQLGFSALETGDWARARLQFQEATNLAQQLGVFRFGFIRGLPGLLDLLEGKTESGLQHLAECQTTGEQIGDNELVESTQVWLAWHDLMEGRAEAAVGRLEPLLDRPGVHLEYDGGPLLTLARAYLAIGDPARAQEVLAGYLSWARSARSQGALSQVLPIQAKILALQGNWDAAATVFEEALTIGRNLSDPFATAQALLDYGLALLEIGETERARVRLEEAGSIFHKLGARPYAEQVEAALGTLADGPGSSVSVS